MFTRDLPELTLAELPDLVRSNDQTWTGYTTQIEISLDADQPTVRLGEHEVRANPETIDVLGGFFEVPTKFLGRIQPDEQQFILDRRIARTKEEYVQVAYGEHGLVEMFRGSQSRVSPAAVVDQLFGVLPQNAQVVEWWSNSEDMRFDIIVPEGFDRGIGGDPEVNDITRGGIRVGQDRKRNLAPWVQPYMLRLRCTNGMEVQDLGLRVDARGAADDEVLAMLAGECSRAFNRVEGDIAAFYDLRNQKVSEDRTGEFRRIAQEQGLPDRTIGRLEDSLPEAISEVEEVTMFEFVNHLTNAALDPALRHRPNVRRNLEVAGGRLVSEHAARCTVCHSKLN